MTALVVTIIILQNNICSNFKLFPPKTDTGPTLDPSQLTSLTADMAIRIVITLQRVYSLPTCMRFL